MNKTFIPALFALFFAFGCRTPLPETSVPPTTQPPRAGYYRMDSSFFYSGLVYMSQSTEKKYTVYLLEKRGGKFGLKKGRNGKYKIVKDDISFDRIKRSLKGQAQLGADGVFRGFALVRMKNMPLIWRDHRKGEFTLRRATPAEAQSRKRKILHPVPGVPLPGE